MWQQQQQQQRVLTSSPTPQPTSAAIQSRAAYVLDKRAMTSNSGVFTFH